MANTQFENTECYETEIYLGLKLDKITYGESIETVSDNTVFSLAYWAYEYMGGTESKAPNRGPYSPAYL